MIATQGCRPEVAECLVLASKVRNLDFYVRTRNMDRLVFEGASLMVDDFVSKG